MNTVDQFQEVRLWMFMYMRKSKLSSLHAQIDIYRMWWLIARFMIKALNWGEFNLEYR